MKQESKFSGYQIYNTNQKKKKKLCHNKAGFLHTEKQVCNRCYSAVTGAIVNLN